MIKRLAIEDIVTWFTTDGVVKMQMAAKLILKLYEDKKEEIYTIAKTNYILGQTDERSQWYKKINEKIEEYQEKRRKAEVQIVNDMYVNYINCLKELIGKEE